MKKCLNHVVGDSSTARQQGTHLYTVLLQYSCSMLICLGLGIVLTYKNVCISLYSTVFHYISVYSTVFQCIPLHFRFINVSIFKLHFFAVSRSSSRRGSCQWSYGYRRRSSPINLPVFHELTQGKEPSPPPSHSTDSNSSGVGNDSPPVSTTVSLNQPLFITPTST